MTWTYHVETLRIRLGKSSKSYFSLSRTEISVSSTPIAPATASARANSEVGAGDIELDNGNEDIEAIDDGEVDDEDVDDETTDDDVEGETGGVADYGRSYARLGGPFVSISEIVEAGLAHESDCEDWAAGVYKGQLTGDPRNMSASGYSNLCVTVNTSFGWIDLP